MLKQLLERIFLHDKMTKLSRQLGWILSTLFLLNGCADSMNLSSDPIKAKTQILKIIPLGTPIKIAEEKMIKRGFRCDYMIHRSSDEKVNQLAEIGEPQKDLGMDYLLCSQQRTWLIILYRIWGISFVYNYNKNITDIYVQVTGPSGL